MPFACQPFRRRHSLATVPVVVGVLAAVLLTSAQPAGALAVAGRTSGGCGPATVTGLDRAIPWAQQRLNFPLVWPITRGAGVTVAVIDTGVDGNQPFLKGAVLRGRDVLDGGGPANTDCVGHGTIVAGIIAGRQLNGFGFAGVAPAATILPIRETSAVATGNARTLADSILAAVKMGASVINISLTSTPDPSLQYAVRYAQTRNVVIVAAAGNDYAQGNALEYPAAFPGVLAVAAADQNGQRAAFSEVGRDVSLLAPGVGLVAPGANGVGLVTASGTSFAAPFVSGVAALVRSRFPRLSAAAVIARIEATADHPPGQLPSPGLGWGMVNPYAAVTAVLPGEHGATALPSPSTVPRPVRQVKAGPVAVAAAVRIAAAGTVLSIVIVLAVGVIRNGRRRGWRPGTRGLLP